MKELEEQIRQKIKFLESIGRDPTGYNYYYIGLSPKKIKGSFVYIPISQESDFIMKISFNKILRLASQFNFIGKTKEEVVNTFGADYCF